MVQTSISVQTKVLLVSAAALATGLAAYALGYYDYDWRLWQTAPDQTQQQAVPVVNKPPVTDPNVAPSAATLLSDPRLPDALVGKPYSTQLAASTGANTRWSLEQGALPSGLTLDEARGVISGTATQPGSSLFRLKFGNNELTGLSQFTLNVVSGDGVVAATTPASTDQAVKIITETLPAGHVGEAYEALIQAVGDDTSVRQWGLRGDAPPGVSMGNDGKLTGTPTQVGSFLVSVVLSGKTSDVSRQVFEVVRQYMLVVTKADVVVTKDPVVKEPVVNQVTDSPLKIVSTTLPAGRVGKEYKEQLVATGGPANAKYSWFLSGQANLPPGLTFTSEGILSGTPTKADTYTLTGTQVKVEGTPNTASFDVTIQILPSEVVVVTPSKPEPKSEVSALVISGGYPDGGIGNYYSARPLEASGGEPPYEWTVSSGNIPTGLYMSPNSQISGYANQYGIFTFVVQVRDQANRTTRAERTISIRPSQPSVSASSDPDLSNRLHRIDLMGVQVHDLIKLQDDGDPNTQYDTTVYYIGADGRRHSFPNPKVYFTWFPDFSRVRIVAGRELADIPLGANLTYRPGSHLVKFATDPRVYAVDSDRRLRWVKTETVAQNLYGPFWARQVDDVSDAFYMDYKFGQDIERPGDYSTSGAAATAVFPSDVLPR